MSTKKTSTKKTSTKKTSTSLASVEARLDRLEREVFGTVSAAREPLGARRGAPRHPLPHDLQEFAELALGAAARVPAEGRFPQRRDAAKVFISWVERELDTAGYNIDGIRARLVGAGQAGLLSLSRADLVEAMPPRDVEESELTHLGATVHFVRLPTRGEWG